MSHLRIQYKFVHFNRSLSLYSSIIVSRLFYCNIQFKPVRVEDHYHFSEDFPKSLKGRFVDCFDIYPDYIKQAEEEKLLAEVEKHMKRRRYEFDHWDNAIQGFRETEVMNWSEENDRLFGRIKELAFPSGDYLPHVHVLDLHEDGHIKPHIDHKRFCGDIIAGLNLLTDAVMRFKKDASYFCDVILKRRSLYIMSGTVRYDFTHELLPNEQSVFLGKVIKKTRRISVILRNHPAQNDLEET